MINGVVQVCSSSNYFYLPATYARFKFRKFAWEEFCLFASHIDGPWLALGDFNEIVAPCEKFGGSPPKTHKMSAFLKCIQTCSLIDAGFSGQKYTWTNRQKQNPNFERLDRALYNSDWLKLYPNSNVLHLPRLKSDHCPILVKTSLPPTPCGRRPFEFEPMWSLDPSFFPMINSQCPVTAGSFDTRILELRSPIQLWAKNVFGSFQKQKKHLMARIEGVQKSLCENPYSSYLFDLDYKLKEELERVFIKEESYWHTRSRANWLSYGDKNTRFFHHLVLNRRYRNRIVQLEDDVGNIVSGQRDIESHVCHYFTNLFTTSKEDVRWFKDNIHVEPSMSAPF